MYSKKIKKRKENNRVGDFPPSFLLLLLHTTNSRISFANPAGSTSRMLSMLRSPISGRLISSLLLARNPASRMPNKLPSRKMKVFRRFRVLLSGW